MWEGPPGNATPSNAVELREATLPLMTTETCQRRAGMFQYKNPRGEVFSESFDVSEFTLCSGLPELLPEVPTGICNGDSTPAALVFFRIPNMTSTFKWAL